MSDVLDLAPFKDLVRLRCGLIFEGVGEESLRAAIAKRMAARGAALAAAYFATLTVMEEEFQDLLHLLTINETYFYREPEQLALLVERLIPRRLAEAGTRLPLRILSAGCSTGEEPYSIAIALREAFGDSASSLVTILAGDIDLQALAKAKSARYGQFSFRGLSPELRERYFRPAEAANTFALDPAVAAMVGFHHLNLMAEGFDPALRDLDIIFFRNVSIYFDEPTRRAIQGNFHDALNERGYLVIGSAETLANDVGVLRLLEDRGAFYFTKGGAPEAPAVPPQAPRPIAPRPIASGPIVPRNPTAPPRARPSATPPPRLETLRELIRDKKFEAALDGIKAHATRKAEAGGLGGGASGAGSETGGDRARLAALEGYIHLMGRDYAAATTAGERALALDDWCVDAMVLLGLVAKWRDDRESAIAWLKKAVYGRHDCWPAHYYLGELHRAAGGVEPARRAYRLASQQIAARPDPDGGLVLPLGLPLADIRFLCERHAGPSSSTPPGGR